MDKFDYVLTLPSDTLVWVLDGKVVDADDMLTIEDVNTVVDHITNDLQEYKDMYEGLCK